MKYARDMKWWERFYEERRPDGWGDVPATVMENFIKAVFLAALLFAAFVLVASPLLNWMAGNEQWYYW